MTGDIDIMCSGTWVTQLAGIGVPAQHRGREYIPAFLKFPGG